MLTQSELEITPPQDESPASSSQKLLVELLRTLAMQGYRFTTVTPVTHQRFLTQHQAPGTTLWDIFGWNVPFHINALSPLLRSLMIEADLLQPCGEFFKSKVRISSLGNDLFLHSAFPTAQSDAVFFGPDTYRFARFIRQTLQHCVVSSADPVRILDIGSGSGAGGVVAVRASRSPVDLTLNDINPLAITYARANAAAATVEASFVHGDVFTAVHGNFDLIISNPPYIKDAAGCAYRDGGAQLGLHLSIRIVQYAISHLAPGGRLLLYTGVAMTGRSDPLMAELRHLLADANCHWSYEEIDPDIFSEELEQPGYVEAYRIAAVGLVVTRRK